MVLFTGAFILPIMTGVLLTCVEPEQKSHANSLANMSYNMLGYLPAPTVYGWANGQNDHSRRGMTLILYASVPSVFMIAMAILAKRVQKPLKLTR